MFTLISVKFRLEQTVTIQTQSDFLEEVNSGKKIFFMCYLKEDNVMTRAL